MEVFGVNARITSLCSEKIIYAEYFEPISSITTKTELI